jgi:hypothetical protein
MLIKIIFLRHVRIIWSRKVRRYQRLIRSRKSKTDRHTIANRNDQIVNSLLQKHIITELRTILQRESQNMQRNRLKLYSRELPLYCPYDYKMLFVFKFCNTCLWTHLYFEYQRCENLDVVLIEFLLVFHIMCTFSDLVSSYHANTRTIWIQFNSCRLKSDSTHHFFRNACTRSGSLRFSQFSGCWLILSVYILMSFDFPFVRLVGVR